MWTPWNAPLMMNTHPNYSLRCHKTAQQTQNSNSIIKIKINFVNSDRRISVASSHSIYIWFGMRSCDGLCASTATFRDDFRAYFLSVKFRPNPMSPWPMRIFRRNISRFLLNKLSFECSETVNEKCEKTEIPHLINHLLFIIIFFCIRVTRPNTSSFHVHQHVLQFIMYHKYCVHF